MDVVSHRLNDASTSRYRRAGSTKSAPRPPPPRGAWRREEIKNPAHPPFAGFLRRQIYLDRYIDRQVVHVGGVRWETGSECSQLVPSSPPTETARQESSRGGGTAPTGPGDRRRGGTHGETSPQQQVQPPGAPALVKKGQPLHGIRRKLVGMGGNTNPRFLTASQGFKTPQHDPSAILSGFICLPFVARWGALCQDFRLNPSKTSNPWGSAQHSCFRRCWK
jgi:hypothetical protein